MHVKVNFGSKLYDSDYYRCHSHRKRRKSDQNRLSFHEKNGRKAEKLKIKLFPC